MEQNPFLAEDQTALFGRAGMIYKGYNVNAQAGSSTTTLQQPGNMTRLVGCALFGTTDLPTDEIIDLKVNNNVVLDSIPALAICPQQDNAGALSGHLNNNAPFFVLMRPISGNADLQFTIRANAPNTFYLVLYFLP